MYKNFYGFREKPFKLVPDPAYLYMSKGHDAAFAQLTYAIEQGEGFVLVTGEVGTGKTTLCRLFLERMADGAESAYIFNTRVSTLQLLESICAEFNLSVEISGNLKVLLDRLNDHFIFLHQQNKKAILVIDEAQNMSVSNLETVRMLSNLETTRNKLLQIVLTGQPELARRLESYALRQLAQRISLNIELVPLSLKDTADFLKHRVAIAAQRQLDLFTPSAVRAIYKYSGGIPRLINISAEYALMSAYEFKKPKVTRRAVVAAIRAIRLPLGSLVQRGFNKKLLLIVTFCVMFLAFTSGLFLSRKISPSVHNPLEVRQTIIPPEPIEEKLKAAPASETAEWPTQPVVEKLAGQPRSITSENEAQATQLEPPAADLLTLLAVMDPLQSRFAALVHLLAMWQQPSPHPDQLPVMVDDATYYQIAALQYGLQLLEIKKDWTLIRKLNLPAVVAMAPAANRPFVYLALTGIRGLNWLITDGVSGQVVEVDVSQLEVSNVGPVYVFWHNLLESNSIISFGAPAAAIMGVKRLLHLAGFNYISMDPIFDAGTRNAVMDFQKQNTIPADGLIGPITKIMLINLDQQAQLPKLNQSPRPIP